MDRNQQLKEARTIEAMKKGYMGLEGKFCTIAKRMGHALIKQGGLYVDRTYLEDPYYLPDENEIATMDGGVPDENGTFKCVQLPHAEEESYEIGVQFDGLSRGINLTISVLFHLREITVRHEGRIVYKEIAGELEGYAPTDDWEDKIGELYSFSKSIERQQKPFEKKQVVEAANKRRAEILEELRLRWGL